ncbi:MAG TPA: hypothetical protein VJ743_05995 [Albitalea sp.]|nr:hypothetical protein [Albitalea sp.]
MTTRFAPWLALAALLAGIAAGPAAAAGCTVLAGGGRSTSADPRELEGWNRLNFSFFDAALTAVGASRQVVPTFLTLGTADAARLSDSVVAKAVEQGCRQLMMVSVFDDPSKPEGELVFALHVAPLRAAGGASAAAGRVSVGATEYEREYRYAATPATLSKVVPSRIAEQAVRDYLQSAAR